jgi:hypothetical protein
MPSSPYKWGGNREEDCPFTSPSSGVEMAAIIPFPVRGSAWARDEHRALVAIQQTLDERGLASSFESGVTDEGDPWALFYGLDDGHSLAHVARWRSGAVLVWADGNVVRAPSVASLVGAVRQAIDQGETTLQRHR